MIVLIIAAALALGFMLGLCLAAKDIERHTPDPCKCLDAGPGNFASTKYAKPLPCPYSNFVAWNQGDGTKCPKCGHPPKEHAPHNPEWDISDPDANPFKKENQ